MMPFLVMTVVAQYSARPSTSQAGQAVESGLDTDVRENLVSTLMGDGLRLEEGGDLGLERVALGFLKEEDAVGEVFVIGSDLGVDLLVSPEVGLGCEDDGHQRELGLVDGNSVPREGVDQTAIQIFEQAAAVLGEGGGGLVENQVMIGLEERILGKRTVFHEEGSASSSDV